MHIRFLSFCTSAMLSMGALLVAANAIGETTGHRPFQDTVSKNKVEEARFVTINGMEQWVTIKGNPARPVILFLHGGPGSTMSPYADVLLKDWEKDFLLVQWDQRGAGKTYGKMAPEELTPAFLKANPLSIDQLAKDGIALAEYLIEHLKKQKIFLFGTSWGSVLGVTIASRRPDLFYAYVGHSQVVDPRDDRRLYDTVWQMAQQKGDTAALSVLRALGKPPYSRARDVGRLWRVVKKYEAASSTPPPPGWFVEAPGYTGTADSLHRSDGDDYSFVNFVGDQVLGVPAMRAGIQFSVDQLEFKVPVYLIQGVHDLLTPASVTKAWFNRIKAPAKEYFLLPHAAHGFNQEVLSKEYNLFMRLSKKLKNP
ncbi:alpha/beta hydrolase [Paraflavitalea sp. CAU 1676]|uniref:alpha/beta fold hydrolase n=1 Tax=Paraflavitalea sp. CAU 1676 TaxID=3032598 RepID=UPI0023DAB970|nr:alpha/beta hydrolase [Paraflavitalea sp. CAU 1676]MDF2192774.1 alpha/beta hydrolase [Paraflavitalea sp. CAU 1676]